MDIRCEISDRSDGLVSEGLGCGQSDPWGVEDTAIDGSDQ